jgi:hypothetical protein
MPRDLNGNYTLPAGNPVASSTIISSTWANPTMSDLGDEITNSLDRNGRGGMLAPFLFADGTEVAPSQTYTLEPASGLYRAGTNDVRQTIGGNDTTRWINATGQVAGEQQPLEIWNGLAWVGVQPVGVQSRLNNDVALQGRDFANANWLNIVKVNPSDQFEFGAKETLMPGPLTVTGAITGDLTGNASGSALTVTQAAQPAITSVGTLTGLTVTDPIVGSITGNALTANTVTDAAQPAITSVGTLLNLTVVNPISGDITGNAGTASSAVIVTQGAQSSITSVGTLTGLTVTAPINGDVTGSAGTAGTVTTAAQPAITSLGTLTSLAVTGSITAGDVTATGDITAFSDSRLKSGIEHIGNALDKVLRLNGCTYRRIDLDGKMQAGLIAQDVLKVLPEAVVDIGGTLAVNYNGTIALLVEAIKELEKRA